MDTELFLDRHLINNYDLILDTIINKGWTPEVLSVENIGDLISIIDYNDKKRDIKDPELKKAVFTVVKAMLETGEVELRWQLTWVISARNSPPKTETELFDFLNEYWDKHDSYGYGMDHLLWFRKIKCDRIK